MRNEMSYVDSILVIGQLLSLDCAGFNISCSVLFQFLKLAVSISLFAGINGVFKWASLPIQRLVLIELLFLFFEFAQFFLNVLEQLVDFWSLCVWKWGMFSIRNSFNRWTYQNLAYQILLLIEWIQHVAAHRPLFQQLLSTIASDPHPWHLSML